MKIVLALDADRGAWPPTTDGSTAQVGGAVIGPRGLVAIVETVLGMRGPTQPQAVRLAHWRAKLASADTPNRFWHASFAVDPFATARTVLAMRDALVEAGWHARLIQSPPPRLADLAAAETSDPVLPIGEPDRLRAVLAELRAALPPTPIVGSLALLDDRPLLPPGLGELVSALEATGTRVEQMARPIAFAPGDLGIVQAKLMSVDKGPLQGDGSFTLLRAETEGAAVEVLADWLAAETQREGMVIVTGRPTGLLDAVLRRRHLPRLGISAFSPLRGLIQALPLALATRWQPFDAVRMLELLQMRHSPVPQEIRSRLIGVLPDCPGRGGAEWRNAIDEGLAARERRLRIEAPDTADDRMRTTRDAVALWLEGKLADPDKGMPIADLAAVCNAIAAWAARMAARDVPLAASLARYASALLSAARDTGLDCIPRLGLERLIDTLLGDGEPDPNASREASEWAAVQSPGAAWGPIRTLVWWGFDTPSLPARSPWDNTELAALQTAGCLPWTAEAALSAASVSWRRPLLNTTDRALLVSIPSADGGLHPLAHEIAPLLEPMPASRPAAEGLMAVPYASLAGRTLPRVLVAQRFLPEARAEWSIPAGLTLNRNAHSATSIEELLGCPFAWVLKGAARLSPGRRAEVADGERLIGLLAHRLAAELFPPGPPGNPQAVRAAAEARMPRLVEQTAAPLLQPGAATEQVRMSERLPVAMEKIALLLGQAGLTVVGAEADRTAPNMPEADESLVGTIDLLLEDADGRPALLDLKWTRAGHRYQNRLEQGLAIQLSAYARLAAAGERAGYFLLADAEAFCLPGGRLGTAVGSTAPTLDATWAGTLTSRQLRMATIRTGTLRALGVGLDLKKPAPDPDGVPTRPMPACNFCEFGRLCGAEPMV